MLATPASPAFLKETLNFLTTKDMLEGVVFRWITGDKISATIAEKKRQEMSSLFWWKIS